MTIREKIERALFGATAEESVAMRLKLIELRVERALDEMIAEEVSSQAPQCASCGVKLTPFALNKGLNQCCSCADGL